MKCRKCNANVKDEAIFCTQCGAKLSEEKEKSHAENEKPFSKFQDKRHTPTILEKVKHNNVIAPSRLKEGKCSVRKIKVIKVLLYFLIVSITVCILIILLNVFNNQDKNQTDKENNIKNLIDNIYKDVTLDNMVANDKYLSVNFKKLIDKAESLSEEPFPDYVIWTNSQDYETVTANIVDCYFISETQAIVNLQIIDSYFGELIPSILYLQYENGDWFVDDIIANNESFKFHTLKYIYENK